MPRLKMNRFQSGPENLQAQADSDETQVEPQLDPNGMVPPQA